MEYRRYIHTEYLAQDDDCEVESHRLQIFAFSNAFSFRNPLLPHPHLVQNILRQVRREIGPSASQSAASGERCEVGKCCAGRAQEVPDGPIECIPNARRWKRGGGVEDPKPTTTTEHKQQDPVWNSGWALGASSIQIPILAKCRGMDAASQYGSQS